jgi:FAD/FMN-containing dehydrogenase
MKRILLIALCMGILPVAMAANDQEEFDMALAETNHYLQNNDLWGCPGTKLVISCGNLQCEPHRGENINNCPADCLANVTIRSYNNITLCDEYTGTHVPYNLAEVQDIVKMASFHGKKVKPIGASHSATDVMCAEGTVIPMEKLNKVIGLSKVGDVDVVETETGITVFALSEWLHEKGYALAGQPHMGFRDVTVGGSIATASHGSTVKHTGVISNIVEAIEFIDGNGNINYLERPTADQDEFKALSASLGLLGIVTKVKLRVQKQFNLAVQISYHNEWEMLKNGLIHQVKDCDYGQLNWFPGVRTFMKTCGKRTEKAAFAGADNELLKPNIPKFIVKPFKKILQYGACYNRLMGLIERVRWWQYKLQPPVVMTNRWGRKKNRRYVIGPSHRMVSSHLIKEQEGFFQMDWEIAVPASRAQEALLAIKEHVKRNRTKLPLVGVFIRFAPAEAKTLLGHTFADGKDWKEGEPAVFFEMPVYVPVGFTEQRFNAYEKQYVEFAQMLIRDFSGRPHWGKNRGWTFDLAIEEGRYQGNLERFKKVMQKYDPQGMFKNRFAEQIGL